MTGKFLNSCCRLRSLVREKMPVSYASTCAACSTVSLHNRDVKNGLYTARRVTTCSSTQSWASVREHASHALKGGNIDHRFSQSMALPSANMRPASLERNWRHRPLLGPNGTGFCSVLPGRTVTCCVGAQVRSDSLPEGCNVLFIAALWPETGSSAAGVRTSSLVHMLLRAGANITYVSAARENSYTEELRGLGVRTQQCAPNREDDIRSILDQAKPTICIFDRFMIEEQFSFHVRAHSPNAVRVLDTQDLHFLRRGRMRVMEAGGSVQDSLLHRPDASSDDLLRELAAIQRSDLTLVCSHVERDLLTRHYGVAPHKVAMASFFCDAGPDLAGLPGFDERRHFMTIGNFLHPPNLDSARWLAQEIWPSIRERLPGAELHIYGAYPTAAAQQLASKRKGNGLVIKGHAPSVPDTMAQYRDAAQGTDANPLLAVREWGGLYSSTVAADIIRDAVALYSDRDLWTRCRATGRRLLESLFPREANEAALLTVLAEAMRSLEQRRQSDYAGGMLWHHTARSTEYFSRWIQLKESLAPLQPSGGTTEASL
eukprot:jgi/Mesvir1/27731/Mv07426-RA.3